ncbi:PREDICTED: O-acyltransferase WSD1-like [Camelina sativa]|uniref:O-acyltransferase WSD1-like n=1 Tax=Camelina sativa TaxID=90675 RepID=A0ABM0THB4_CAMSA|nr:PREDICTED: O-acyltransferase WSD1-like [Camelina sativa]
MEIKTRQHMSETTVENEEEKEEEQPLSPTARLFHAREFNCYIISVIGLKKKIEPDVIIEGMKQTLIRHPRFSSKLVNSWNNNREEQKWVRTNVVVEDHVIIPKIETQNIENANADAFLESYLSDLTTIHLDTSKPLWEVHLLDLKTSDAENVVVFKIHHSVGDGMSMMSLVLACTRKTSDPNELPSLPYHNRLSSGSSPLKTSSRCYSRLFWPVMVLWSAVVLVWNTVCDALEFIATTLFLKDTETPIKGNFRLSKSKQMRLVHRTVSLDDIKLIKNAMNMTVNDVVLGVSQAGLSKYLNRRYGEKTKAGEQEESKKNSSNMPKKIRLRAVLLVNIRPTTGIQDLADMMAKGSKCRWGNWIGYIFFPFSIALCDDPLEHLVGVKSIIDQKKNSFEAVLTFAVGNLLIKLLGVQRAAQMTIRTLSNTTMAFSNLVGPIEEVSLYGNTVTYIAPSAYGHPHALTMHFQSYMNKMTMSLTVDPTVISDPHRLCDDLEESLRSIKTAVQKRGFTQ